MSCDREDETRRRKRDEDNSLITRIIPVKRKRGNRSLKERYEMNGWTKDEKYSLLQALKEFSSNDLKNISTKIPSKTSAEIKKGIDYYKRRGSILPMNLVKRRQVWRNAPEIPLASWVKFITDSQSFEELQTGTSTALRLIAEFEEIPAAACTENIDFRKIYRFVANALDGKPLPNDKIISTIIEKCIVETALISKTFVRNTTFRNILDLRNILDREICTFPKPTVNNELACLRHLESQRSYNPLNIPERNLKPSSD